MTDLLERRALARFDTPAAIADFLAGRLVKNSEDDRGEPGHLPAGFTVCDPTCGGGALLLAARKQGAQVYGVDRDPAAAEEAALHLGETLGGRIKVGDALVDPLPPDRWPAFIAAHRALIEAAGRQRLAALEQGDSRALAQADAGLADLKTAVLAELPRELAGRGFCWLLEFPEIAVRGFDAVLTNPPWDKLKVLAQEIAGKGAAESGQLRREVGTLARWVTSRWGSAPGDRNAYQGVLALAMALIRPGGALGAVVPGGFWTDLGARSLRMQVLQNFEAVSTWGLEARTDAFPDIDQRVAILVGTRAQHVQGASHLELACGLRQLAELPTSCLFPIPVSVLRRTAPISLAFPPLAGPRDLEILELLYLAGPTFGGGPWQPAFGRDIDMTNDAPAFEGVERGAPLWEGKRTGAFELCPIAPVASGAWPGCARTCSRSRHCPATRKGGRQLWVDETRLARRDSNHAACSRVAWRSVARGDRARRLEAALVPAGFRLGNSLNYLQGDRHTDAEKLTLLAYLNSWVLEWRFRQLAHGNNVNLFAIRQLPVPPGPRRELWEPAASLMAGSAGWSGALLGPRQEGAGVLLDCPPATEIAERQRLRWLLDARVARAFDLEEEQFEYLLSTFPKLTAADRTGLLNAFTAAEAVLPAAPTSLSLLNRNLTSDR